MSQALGHSSDNANEQFMFQAVMFYLPRCIWLSMEGGLMHFLVEGNTGMFFYVHEYEQYFNYLILLAFLLCAGRLIEEPEERKQELLQNYCEQVHNRVNNYTYCFFFCELLNFIILLTQVFLTNIFLSYKYLDFGYQVYKFYMLPPEERMMFDVVNPMCEVFPKGCFN